MMPERSSLDRLKALSDLPDAEVRLDVVADLVTHGARSEMIVRWGFGRLERNDQAKCRAEYWKILGLCFRTIVPVRLAALLASSGFSALLSATIGIPHLPYDTFEALAGALILLIEVYQPHHVVHLAAILSLKASSAADFFSSWLRLMRPMNRKSQSSIKQDMLRPVLVIWDSRKRSPQDDDLFSQSCTPGALAILQAASQQGVKPSKSTKRTAGAEQPLQNSVTELESLVAKHTILPVRAQFLTSGSNSGDLVQATAKMETALLMLGSYIQSDDSSSVADLPATLLDVALRSISKPTPRQMFKERPWIDALFRVLQRCSASLPDSESQTDLVGSKLASLYALLDVLSLHGFTVSSSILSNTIIEGTWTGDGVSRLGLISRIAEIDSNVLIAKAVSDVVVANIKIIEDSDGELDSAVESQLDATLSAAVKSFTQARMLDQFIQICYDQLGSSTSPVHGSAWHRIQAGLSTIVEEVLQDEQMMKLLTTYAAIVEETANSAAEGVRDDTQSRLSASLHILKTLISGFTRESLIVACQECLHDLHDSLMLLFNEASPQLSERVLLQMWNVLFAAFQIWFPYCTGQKGVRFDGNTEAETILKSKAVMLALEWFTSKNAQDDLLAVISNDVDPRLNFVCGICKTFASGYGDVASDLAMIAMKEMCSSPEIAQLALCLHPELFDGLDKQDSATFLQQIRQHIGEEAYVVLPDSMNRLLQASSAPSINQKNLLHGIIEELEGRMEMANLNEEVIILQTLAKLPNRTIERPQQENLVQMVLGRSTLEMSAEQLSVYEERLAVLLHLVAANPSVVLLKDSRSIWKLAEVICKTPGSKSNVTEMGEVELFRVMDLLGELSWSVVRTWLRSSNRDWQRRWVEQTTEKWQESVATLNKLKNISTVSELLTLRVAIAVAHALKDAYLAESQVAYEELLLHVLQQPAALPRKGRGQAIMQRLAHKAALVALLEHWRSRNDSGQASISDGEVLSAIKDLQSNHGPASLELTHFQLLSSLSPASAVDCVDQYLQMMSGAATARRELQVLHAFEQSLSRTSAEERAATLLALINHGEGIQPRALLLQKSLIAIISKDDADVLKSIDPKSILLRTVLALSSSPTLHQRQILLEIVVVILREKPFLLNQHGIEQIVPIAHQILATSNHIEALFPNICRITNLLLTQHRSRLQGRNHLIVTHFQNLLTALFQTTAKSSPSNARNARFLARLLELFCRPPHIRSRHKTSALVDETRKAQAQAGQVVQHILHHYCALVLSSGSQSDQAAREAVMPGLWSMIEAIEVNGEEGIKALSAAMNHNERAVLRGVYEDWKKFGRWEGL